MIKLNKMIFKKIFKFKTKTHKKLKQILFKNYFMTMYLLSILLISFNNH